MGHFSQSFKGTFVSDIHFQLAKNKRLYRNLGVIPD